MNHSLATYLFTTNKHKKLNIQIKMGSILVIVTTLILAGFGTYQYSTHKHNITHDLNYLAEITIGRLADNLALPVWTINEEQVEKTLISEMLEKRIYAIVIQEIQEDAIISGKIRNNDWQIIDTADDIAGDFIKRSQFIVYDDEKIANLEIYLTKNFMEIELNNRIQANIIKTIFLDIALMVALMVIIQKTLLTPISHLAKEVNNIASGNLNQSIKATSHDEIGQLVSDVETMRLSIKNLTDHLECKVKERTMRLQDAHEEILSLNQQLKVDNLRMGAELDISRQIQQMILPSQHELDDIERLDIAAFMQPAEEVGGDYYDVISYNGVTHIGIGDVTGHGLESGILMLMTQTIIRTLIVNGENDIVKMIDTLNRSIFGNIQRMQCDKCLTLALLEYNAGKIKLTGQHEEIIVVRQGGQIELIDTADLGFPIGLDNDIFCHISQIELSLAPGDGVVVYTDGITEAENINDEQYGLEKLCEAIRRNWEKPAEEIKQAVIDDVLGYIGKQTIYDDITLVILKRMDIIES